MTQIDINPIILLIATALVSGFTLLSKYFFEAWTESRAYEKKKRLERNDDGVKAKRIFEELESLNQKEDTYKEKESARLMANNMAVLMNQTECNKIITKVVLNSAVQRFILFHTHNGNGQPNSLKPFKVSYLQYNAVHTSEIKNYQNLEVDNEYAKLMIEIQNSEKHFICLVVDEMEDCLLKQIYRKERMKYVEIYFLCATNTGIIYTSLATNDRHERFVDSRLEIIYAISNLKAVFAGENNRVFRDVIEREENETRLKEIFKEKERLKLQL